MAVTQNDLNNLETKIKLDISKEQTEYRHWDRAKMQTTYNIVDELKTDVALSKQSLTNMTNSIEKLEEVVKEWFTEMKNEFKIITNTFVKKEDYKENHEHILNKTNNLEKALDNINLKIAGVSGWFAVIIYLIDKYAK